MPNIASVLKEEISRIARKETRRETSSLKKSSTVAAEVILTHCAEVEVTHLGKDDGLFGAVDVDPGAGSGDTSDGPKG